MTWEEKFSACQALCDHSLRMRKPGDWYVSQVGAEISNGSVLIGGCVIGASTPQEAVEQHWEWLTRPKPDEWLVLDAHRPTRQALAWNGFMWARITEPRR